MAVAFCSAPFSIIVSWAFDFLLGNVAFEKKQTCLFRLIKWSGKGERTDSLKVDICEKPWQLPKVLVFLFVNNNTSFLFVMLEQLGFYFNEGTQCSLYLIYTEYMKMACWVIPVEKCWPEDAVRHDGGRGELPTWSVLRRGSELAVVSISASTE